MNFQELEGDALDWALQQIDYEYYPYTDGECFLKMIKRHRIDAKWILFDEKFKQYPIHGSWMAGMFNYDNVVPQWKTAYGQIPELAVARVFVRSMLGDNIDVPKEYL